MADGLSGDFDALSALSAALSGADEIVRDVAAESVIELRHAVDSQFTLGTDPYGNAWEPLAPVTIGKGRTPPPLTDTGKMRDSLQVTVTGESIRFSMGGPAVYHQHGGVRLPQRKIFPGDPDPIPPIYEAAITDALRAVSARWKGAP